MVAAYSRVAIGIEGGAYYGKNDAWVWHLSADERALAGIKEEPSPMDSHIPDEEIHRLNKSPAPYTWPVKKWPGFLPEVESFLAASGYKPEEVLEDDDGNLYDLERRMLIAFPAGIIEMRQKQKLRTAHTFLKSVSQKIREIVDMESAEERANHRPQIIEYLGLMLVQGVLKPFENHLERTGTPAMVRYFHRPAHLGFSPPASPPPSPSSASTLAQPETHEVSQAPVTLASSSTIPKKKKSKKVKKAKKQRDKKKAAEIAALSTARSPSRSPSPSPSRLSHVSGILEEAVDCVCASSRPLSTDQSAVHRDCACGVSTLATIRHKSSQNPGHRSSDAAFESELSYDSVTARAPTQNFGLGSWSAPPSPRASSSALPLPREGPIPAGRPGMRRTFPGISVQVSMAVRGGRKQGDEAVAEDSGWGKGEVALLIEFLH
ncbi:hypothetical protein N7470_001288 [Penicillium chermesinum]|nr:hypothetical protein N7470_001288 [Penicillium chermesinum]